MLLAFYVTDIIVCLLSILHQIGYTKRWESFIRRFTTAVFDLSALALINVYFSDSDVIIT